MFSTGSLDGFGFDFGKSIGDRGSITIVSTITKVLGIGFRFSLSRAFHNNGSAGLANNVLALLYVDDFLAHNIRGDAGIFGTWGTGLNRQNIGSMFAGWVNMSFHTPMVKLRICPH